MAKRRPFLNKFGSILHQYVFPWYKTENWYLLRVLFSLICAVMRVRRHGRFADMGARTIHQCFSEADSVLLYLSSLGLLSPLRSIRAISWDWMVSSFLTCMQWPSKNYLGIIFRPSRYIPKVYQDHDRCIDLFQVSVEKKTHRPN